MLYYYTRKQVLYICLPVPVYINPQAHKEGTPQAYQVLTKNKGLIDLVLHVYIRFILDMHSDDFFHQAVLMKWFGLADKLFVYTKSTCQPVP